MAEVSGVIGAGLVRELVDDHARAITVVGAAEVVAANPNAATDVPDGVSVGAATPALLILAGDGDFAIELPQDLLGLPQSAPELPLGGLAVAVLELLLDLGLHLRGPLLS